MITLKAVGGVFVCSVQTVSHPVTVPLSRDTRRVSADRSIAGCQYQKHQNDQDERLVN